MEEIKLKYKTTLEQERGGQQQCVRYSAKECLMTTKKKKKIKNAIDFQKWMHPGPILHINGQKHPHSTHQSLVEFLPPAAQRTRLEHVLPAAERIIGCRLLSMKELQDTIADGKPGKIAADLANPGNHLFEKHSSERQYRSINTMITHHLNSFLPELCHLTQALLPSLPCKDTLCIPSVPGLFILI